MNKNESGRSMVEMLGVLAIIGVLSIVGIAGYRQAMNKLQANELVNSANQKYIEHIVNNQGVCAGENNKALDGSAIVNGASISITCGTGGAEDTVTITGNDIPSAVKEVINAMGITSPIIAAS